MTKQEEEQVRETDPIRYLASPFASWLDRYYVEDPDAIAPDATLHVREMLARRVQRITKA
jgi:hypothetical protein